MQNVHPARTAQAVRSRSDSFASLEDPWRHRGYGGSNRYAGAEVLEAGGQLGRGLTLAHRVDHGPAPELGDQRGRAADDDFLATEFLRVERVERLACDFPLKDNYFAWQAFSRGYDIEGRNAVPPYLREENYAEK